VTEPAAQLPKPLRTWRPMAAWTAAILLALGLAWFVAAVVVPAWRVRAEVLPVMVQAADMREEPGDYVIQSLGGGSDAARKLGAYLRLPALLARHRRLASAILGQCGHYACSELARCSEDQDCDVRREAIEALGRLRSAQAVVPLIRGLGDNDERIRAIAASALGDIGPEASAAIPALNKCLSEWKEPTRTVAAEALKKIRGEEAKP
jgi:hypothetical protein